MLDSHKRHLTHRSCVFERGEREALQPSVFSDVLIGVPGLPTDPQLTPGRLSTETPTERVWELFPLLSFFGSLPGF